MDYFQSVDLIRARLKRLRGQWRRVSVESGVPYTTIKNLMQGVAKNPSIPTASKLSAYFASDRSK